jgi:hypothetical protein
MFVVIEGNIIDGMRIHGPFASAEEANEWADREVKTDWWCAALFNPQTGV